MKFPEDNDAAVRYRLGHQYSLQGKTVLNAGRRFHRSLYESQEQNLEILADDFGNNTLCEFIRTGIRGEEYFRLSVPGEYDLLMTKGTGWFLRGRLSDTSHYWLPLQPVARTYDRLGRIVSEAVLPVVKIDRAGDESYALFSIPAGYSQIETVVWTFPQNSGLLDELHILSGWELQSMFLWGSHTEYSGPCDLYNHIIHGVLYENRWSAPKYRWKAFAEVDALSLFIALDSMNKTTGKKMYEYMKTQIVFSVMFHQDGDGAWRQGLLTDIPEEHYRYQCSAIHMLSADYEQTGDMVVLSALRNAVEYMKVQCESLTVGRWYLHDSLEKSIGNGQRGPASFYVSNILGKSDSNMLVLNTHLDAILALHRFEEVTGEGALDNEIMSGVDAALAVLGLSSADIIYRFLFSFIELTFYPVRAAREFFYPVRIMRRLARIIFIPLLPVIKKFFPRFVMPSGYIDRDLAVNHFCYVYHSINTMDLLRFQRRFRKKILDDVIDKAIDLAQRVRLPEQWVESRDTEYAAGFWAEAMYLECLRNRNRDRAVLAQAVVALLDSGQGLPPSLLGYNSEYVPLKEQIPHVCFQNNSVRVVNLSSHECPEFLFVNGTDNRQEIVVPLHVGNYDVYDNENNSIESGGVLSVPPRSWVRLLPYP